MATTDVSQKANDSNPRREGTIVVGAQVVGNYDVVTDNNNPSPTSAENMETALATRFDDPQYYTA